MPDEVTRSVPVPPPSSPPPAAPPSRRVPLWLRAVAFLLMIAAAAVFVVWSGLVPLPDWSPLQGKLQVVIRPGDAADTKLVQEEGAVPVRAGAGMSMQIEFTRPMYAFLVWLD